MAERHEQSIGRGSMNSQIDYRSEFSNELLGTPSAVMEQYLEHFSNQANDFITGLVRAMQAWNEYYSLQGGEQTAEALAWSKLHFLNAINCAVISTRLFLAGYLVASGNQS